MPLSKAPSKQATGYVLLCAAVELRPSLHEFSTVLMRRLSMPVELTVDALVGYASSWSAYSIHRARHPQQPDPLVEYRARLVAALDGQVRLLHCLAREGGREDASLLCW